MLGRGPRDLDAYCPALLAQIYSVLSLTTVSATLTSRTTFTSDDLDLAFDFAFLPCSLPVVSFPGIAAALAFALSSSRMIAGTKSEAPTTKTAIHMTAGMAVLGRTPRISGSRTIWNVVFHSSNSSEVGGGARLGGEETRSRRRDGT